jgi:hypothetical protein
MNETPLLKSKCSLRTLWQEYMIFANRIELHTHVGIVKVPLSAIERIEVLGPVLNFKNLALHLKNFRFPIKIDMATLHEHILLDKSNGIIHRLLFTPEDPEEFKRVVESLLANSRQSQPGTALNA